MSNIQLFSFQPKEAPRPMLLRETPPGNVGPASLPRELFLQIAELLVDDITGSDTPASWKLDYCYDAPSKLVIKDEHMTIGPMAGISHSQMLRFKKSRLPSQIDSETRLMVHKKFIRITMLTEYDTISPIDAWVRPDIDRFVPYCPASRELYFRQAMTLPTPPCDSLIKSIRRIHLGTLYYINELNAVALGSFAALPYLTKITAVVADWAPDHNERIVHHGIRKIDPIVYPTLDLWVNVYGSTFASIFRPLKDNGVKLVVGFNTGGEPFLEISDTEKGIRIQNLIANCNCCSQDKLS